MWKFHQNWLSWGVSGGGMGAVHYGRWHYKEISSTTFIAQTVLDCYRKIKIKWNENWVHTRDKMLVTSSSKLQHTHSALAQQWWLAAKWRVWQSTPRYSTCWVPPWQCSTQISTLETCPNTALSVNPAIKYIECILATFAIGFWISSEVILLSSCRTGNNASCRLSLKIQLGAKVFREDKHLAMIDGCSVARTYPLLTDGAGAGSYRCAVQDTDTHLGQCSAMCSADTTTTRPLLSANTN